ncbi:MULTISPECIES: ATP phosphoribosyltransferase regulatory subunit [unclassified Paracoccus (in: a-proteobacteria)]|uniref:ATP phosphoribosyltransferase regulatory subunit n=1 Tax=unclassified Paracoccus (in: a-proteobacteria) TaxID=2688777 RepID=UPI0012B39E87|nr:MULTISPECIES: ATP phosphoribosyltransferase regulatory subunit [unclassified Paracoccus (in: a-proteobacteria)]UXU73966.1 ATP phosphoribosyltransferase regulatory subunit [Paracoccus sp. SMMA_5]UXU79853.1 ATP phosphoribosyltransferase regulatory subunit [Paracoccus sp. SMMA_5_TC]
MSKREKQAIGQQILAAFRAAGAQEVAPDLLLPAETLLDLYGEDIRARAYVTQDPIRGEVMLRPDFTVPVVQMHMQSGAEPARYCYLGEVFRKQDQGEYQPEHPRDNEYLQAGFELFARDPDADAEVFALFHDILSGLRLQAVMGDMDLLMDAVRALPLSGARRAALLHHIWRPRRFARLLERFASPATPRDFPASSAPWTGLRSPEEMQARIERLEADGAESPLAPVWVERLQRLFAIDAPAPQALAQLRLLAAEIPDIAEAANRLDRNLTLLSARGIDVAAIRFDASHGRHTMEYYDGMTFSFLAPGRADWPPVATGGRYDALAAVLGQAQGRSIPAVGGIIRPGLVHELGGLG